MQYLIHDKACIITTSQAFKKLFTSLLQAWLAFYKPSTSLWQACFFVQANFCLYIKGMHFDWKWRELPSVYFKLMLLK